MVGFEEKRAEEKRTSSVSDSRYAKLEADMEKQNQIYIDSNKQRQEQMIKSQDHQLEAISRGVGVLKDVSYAIGDELDDHNEMLDDLHTDLVNTHSRLGSVSAKMNRVLELSGKKKELIVIVILLILIVVVIALFFIPI
ncbi:syntaxin-6-like isoform X2 [Oopsacas minuta]|uniref:Syntaxin-6-like isoform X2 n=1 Tax=Oopsacas minuta TaxID=111878 RepID=A0AAV7JES4_9METZ|nr:syntaxin-6-like isoform X2 [Oopsacas minuta]